MGMIASHYYLYSLGDKRKENKMLICAPSNTAVDEIVKKLKVEGIEGVEGEKRVYPRIVRVGRIETNNNIVVESSIDYICE
jgi:hypothetical protein